MNESFIQLDVKMTADTSSKDVVLVDVVARMRRMRDELEALGCDVTVTIADQNINRVILATDRMNRRPKQ